MRNLFWIILAFVGLGCQAQTVEKLEEKLKELSKDESNVATLHSIAEIYYRDFIRPTWKDEFDDLTSPFTKEDTLYFGISPVPTSKESVIPNSGKKALEYFYKIWNADTDSQDILYFPIRQLETYLKVPSRIYKPKKRKNAYFPTGHFMNLTKDWEHDLTVDYLFEAESSKRNIEWYERQLIGLKETSLSNFSDKEIYRFTYLPSFDHPVAIRLEHDGKSYRLFCKVGKGAGGYEPKGIKKEKQKKISEKEWQTFIQLLTYADYQNLPNEKYVLMTDGEQWIIEYKSQDNYFAKSTNYPSPEFKNACQYLLKLADVKIRE